MVRTPDRFPGEREEDIGVILDSQSEEPQSEGEIRNVNGNIHMKDSLGVFNPRTGGSATTFENLILTTDGGVIYSSTGGYVLKEVA